MTTKTGKTAAEKAALAALNKQDKKDVEPEARLNFVPGKPLPEGFVNPPIGDQDHRCVNSEGVYDPTWVQIEIQKVHDHQQNPQVFPLMGVEYTVNLDEWTDCPPCILESLKSAVETRHNYNATPGQVRLGENPVHERKDRKRFVYAHYRSA